ncbi:MAG TPA: FAD:protein FMN transferase [Pseudonocardiaceae bacterium]|jgi:thiamine biosynthesis lipoprotein|nr:FAD:protein FMN transferase [Pseudonocardiaceae bacterium]
MPPPDLLPTGHDTQQWPIWSTTARIVVTEPDVLPVARQIVDSVLAAVDEAGNRFRADSELRRLDQADGRPTMISPLLADLIDAALRAAERTNGDVDPTIGIAMESLGYDRDLSLIDTDIDTGGHVEVAAPGWYQIRLYDQEVTIPVGIRLDLGAVGKAYAADLCATLVAAACETGVLISIGGDIATAGPAPTNGWHVLVSDGPTEPSRTVRLAGGMAMATSSTVRRQWHRGGRLLHHILDPRTCQPTRPVWRTVTVVAPSCVDANTQTTAAMVRGLAAPGRLGLPARLVAADGSVRTVNGWPSEVEAS